MKPLFLFLAFSCLSLVSIAQSKGNIRLYGYKQYVSGGKRPQSANNSGPVTTAGAGKNYFLYAVSSSRIYPSEIWIEGVRYGVTIKSISKTPVEMSDPFGGDGPKKVLVPSTKEKVVQLIPNSASTTKSSATKASSLAKRNELVLIYKKDGKFYYNTLEKLSDSESAAMN